MALRRIPDVASELGVARVVLVVAAAIVLLVAGGAVAAFVVTSDDGGGSSLAPMPTDDPNYRPITVRAPNEEAVDPDSTSVGGQDLSATIVHPSGDRYRVVISNTSGIGYINALNWNPPDGMRITQITSSSAGRCRLSSGDQRIVCSGLKLKPPTCTCRSDGGELVVSFVAKNSGTGLLAGASAIVAATPVLKVIPGYATSPDLKPCPPGVESTLASPCASS